MERPVIWTDTYGNIAVECEDIRVWFSLSEWLNQGGE